ncbi:MAG: hypothetical protein ACRDKT_05315 [Actinomycetota bacterium]
MRKLLAVLAAAGMVAALGAVPAAAGPGKGKHVKGELSGTLLPFPNLSSSTGTPTPGCSAGAENVHWVGLEFKSPGKGTLKFSMSGFQGDHDLYVLKDGVAIARSDNAQVPDMAPPEEEILLPMKKGDTVLLVACNWMGEPNVLAIYEGHFK